MRKAEATLFALITTLVAAPAAACGPSFEPFSEPVDFLVLWLIVTVFIGWMGSIWTTVVNWRYRENLGFWKMTGIALLAAPALGFIAILMTGMAEFLDRSLSLNNSQEIWVALFAVGMAAVYQTGFSLGAYRLFQKRDA